MTPRRFKNNRILLFNNPLAPRICPGLAKEIGLNESIILLQMEFWIVTEGEEQAGGLWVRKTVREIQQTFSFLSLGTVSRTIDNLLQEGFLMVGDFDAGPGRGSRWFQLNSERLTLLKSIRVCSDSEQPMFNPSGESAKNGSSVLIDIKKKRESGAPAKDKSLCAWKEPSGSMHAWAEENGFSSEQAEEWTRLWYHRRRANSVYHTEAEWLEDWQAWMITCRANEKRGAKKAGASDRHMNKDQQEGS